MDCINNTTIINKQTQLDNFNLSFKRLELEGLLG